jgi:hypothetical protein
MLISGVSTGGVASVAIGISADEIIIDQRNEVLANPREFLQQMARIEGK